MVSTFDQEHPQPHAHLLVTDLALSLFGANMMGGVAELACAPGISWNGVHPAKSVLKPSKELHVAFTGTCPKQGFVFLEQSMLQDLSYHQNDWYEERHGVKPRPKKTTSLELKGFSLCI